MTSVELLEVTIHSLYGKRRELLNACRVIAEQTRQEPGCVDSRVSQDVADENLITLKQVWEHWCLLNDYFRSDHFIALLGAMKWLGKNYAIRINDGTKDQGMDAIEKARGTKTSTLDIS